MKKVIVLSLIIAIALSACDALYTATEAPAPAEPTTVPPTAEVVVVTVEVPVEVTSEQPAAAEPTATQPPAPTAEPPTAVPPTEAAPAESSSGEGPITVPSNLWSPYFKDVTYSSDSFSLRCFPGEITISGTTTNADITVVELYYRIEDRNGTTVSEWKNAGRMQSTGNGIFSKTISGEDIHPDLRKALTWFDFQLVGLNKGGAAVGRTEKIVQQVTYTIDCQ